LSDFFHNKIKNAFIYEIVSHIGLRRMFCQSCGTEIPTGTAACPKCNFRVQPIPAYAPPAPYPYVYPPPFLFWKSALAGFFILFAAIFCLLSTIFIFFDWIFYYIDYPEDFYYSEIVILFIIFIFSMMGFLLGIISAIMCFKRTRFYIPVLGTTILLVTSIFMFFDYFAGFGFLILMMSVPGFIFLFLGKAEFDMPAGQPQPFYPTPPPVHYPPYPPPAVPKPSPTVKLMELQKLKEKEIITQEEFDTKKKELLDKF
jgi:hypothetical protein